MVTTGPRIYLQLPAAMTLSLLIYFAASATLFDKPVSYDSIVRMMARKTSYAEQLPSPKLVLIGGSGVRTSHLCSVLGDELGLPCVNGGSTVGLGVNYIFEEYRPFLRPGDIVYMPLEYQQYLISRAEMLTGPDAAILFRSDWRRLTERGYEGFGRAAFMVDLIFIAESSIEQALAAGGVQARFDKQQSNAQGDQTGLTHKAGRPYDSYLAQSPWSPPPAAWVRTATGAKQEVARFLDWCRNHGVRVFAGLPVAFDDRPIPDPLIAELREFYGKHGVMLIVMDNRSQYPRSYFYDSAFHLEEARAVGHSMRLAPYLRAALDAATAPEGKSPASALSPAKETSGIAGSDDKD